MRRDLLLSGAAIVRLPAPPPMKRQDVVAAGQLLADAFNGKAPDSAVVTPGVAAAVEAVAGRVAGRLDGSIDGGKMVERFGGATRKVAALANSTDGKQRRTARIAVVGLSPAIRTRGVHGIADFVELVEELKPPRKSARVQATAGRPAATLEGDAFRADDARQVLAFKDLRGRWPAGVEWLALASQAPTNGPTVIEHVIKRMQTNTRPLRQARNFKPRRILIP